MLLLLAYFAEQGQILKEKTSTKTDADLFMVIHKSALRPKTNTVEPLMQGSHNMSSG